MVIIVTNFYLILLNQLSYLKTNLNDYSNNFILYFFLYQFFQ